MPDYKNYNEDRTKKLCFTCRDMLDIELFRIKEKKRKEKKRKEKKRKRNTDEVEASIEIVFVKSVSK